MPHLHPSPRRPRPPALLVLATLVVVVLLVLAGCRADPPPSASAASDGSATPTTSAHGHGRGPSVAPARSPGTEALEAALLADVAAELGQPPGAAGGLALHPGCTPLLMHVLSIPWAWAELAPGDRVVVEDLRATWRAEAPAELQADLAAAHAIVEEVAGELEGLRATAADLPDVDADPPSPPVPSVTLGEGRTIGAVEVASATDAGLQRLKPVLERVDTWVQARCTAR